MQFEAIDGGAATRGKKSGFGFQDAATFHSEPRSRRGIFHFDGALIEPELHAESCKAFAEARGNFGVKKGQKHIAAVDQRDLNAESHEDRGILAADDAAADDGKTFGDAVHLKKSVRIKSMNIIESDFRRTMRLGAAGNENNFTAQTTCAIRAGNYNRVGVFKSCLTAYEFDLVQREIFENALPFHFDDFAFMVHEVVHGEIFFQRIVNAVKAALLQTPRNRERIRAAFCWGRFRY